MDIVNISDAKVDLDGFMAKVLAGDEPTIVRTATGESVVVVPLEDFGAWQETSYLLKDPANAAHLRQSIAEAKADKTSLVSLARNEAGLY